MDKRTIVDFLPEEAGGKPPETNLPETKAERSITVAGFTLTALVLADGRRVIEKTGFDKLLAYVASRGSITPSESKAVNDFLKGFGK